MKYRVNYRSVGLLTGREPGDTVELDSHDAARLQSFGLVSPLSGPAEQPTAGPAETKTAEPLDVDQYHTGGGWYTMPDGEKVRGEDGAREYLEGLNGKPSQPASGQ